LLWCVAGLTAAGPAAAQPAEAPRPRTGPDAAPPIVPPFAVPVISPLPQEAPSAATLPSPETGSELLRLRIVEEQAGRDAYAVPPAGWTPAADALSGLSLDHRPGVPLNAAWVRRQFALNGPDGIGASRAVALVQLINRAFLGAGFINSGLLVEPQSPPGLLTVRLVHGGLTAIEIAFAEGGARGLDPDYVRERLPSATRRPLSASALERDFRLLTEDSALRTVTAQLRPGAAPGEAGLALTILPRERADLYLTAGNSRSPTVGGERVGAGGYLRNALWSGDLLSAEGGLTRGVVDASLAYTTPAFDPRTSLNLRASYNEAAVIDAPLVPLDIRTRDSAYQVGLVRQLLREPLTPDGPQSWSPSRTLSAGIGISHRRQRSFLLGAPFSFAPGSVGGRAEYTALRLIGDYVVRNVDEVFALSLTGTMGLDGTRSSDPLVLNPDRNFLALLAQLNYARRLTGKGLELRARLTGQVASSVLYSGERLGIGGEGSVRGYRETLLLADQGLVGSVELAMPITFSGEAARGRAFDWGAFSVSAFAEGAYADNVEGPEPSPDVIGSVGVAMTWQPTDSLSLSVAYGQALVDVDPTGTTDIQDGGIHVRFTLYPLRLLRGR
jgi:hemolysin activation/secretion protein